MNEMIELKTMDAELQDLEATAKRFGLAGTMAKAMAHASILPDHLRTKKVGGKIVALSPEEVESNCILIADQALRWNCNPTSIMQSTFVIGGKLGFEGRLLAAIVNTRGGLSKKLSYEFKGDGAKLSCVS